MAEFTLSVVEPVGKFTLSDVDSSGIYTLTNEITNTYTLGEVVLSTIGAASTVAIKQTYTAGEVIGGHKVVYLKGGEVFLADNSNNECIGSIIGMSNQAAGLGANVDVILQGEITLTPWGLTQDSIYFLGTSGAITVTPPSTGLLYKIGYAQDTNTLVINHNLLINRN